MWETFHLASQELLPAELPPLPAVLLRYDLSWTVLTDDICRRPKDPEWTWKAFRKSEFYSERLSFKSLAAASPQYPSIFTDPRIILHFPDTDSFSRRPSTIKESEVKTSFHMKTLETWGSCRQMHNCSPAVVFHRVFFAADDVSHINPLYEEVFGRENESDCEFLGWQTKTGARCFLPLIAALWLSTAAPSCSVSPVINTEIYRKKSKLIHK